MAVITISREYGSGGDEVAAQVRKMLGYRYFDKWLMARIATEMGLTHTEVIDFSEENYKVQGFLDRLLAWRGPRVVAEVGTWTADVAGTRTREVQQLDEMESIALVRGTIESAYKQGNVIIVGRAGQAILKDKPDVLRVRLEAPLDLRSRRIQEQEQIGPAEAQERVFQHDRAAADYMRRFYDMDWADPHLYDLIINTGKLGLEGAAHLIVGAVGYLPATEPDQ